MIEIEFDNHTEDELAQADYVASLSCRCPICEKQLDHCGSGHHPNCPINEAIYVPNR
jgi:hypothetical protein